jgi:predicted nucleotidyltransferase
LIKLALACDELADILGRAVDLRTIREFATADRIRIEAEAIAL